MLLLLMFSSLSPSSILFLRFLGDSGTSIQAPRFASLITNDLHLEVAVGPGQVFSLAGRSISPPPTPNSALAILASAVRVRFSAPDLTTPSSEKIIGCNLSMDVGGRTRGTYPWRDRLSLYLSNRVYFIVFESLLIDLFEPYGNGRGPFSVNLYPHHPGDSHRRTFPLKNRNLLCDFAVLSTGESFKLPGIICSRAFSDRESDEPLARTTERPPSRNLHFGNRTVTGGATIGEKTLIRVLGPRPTFDFGLIIVSISLGFNWVYILKFEIVFRPVCKPFNLGFMFYNFWTQIKGLVRFGPFPVTP